MISIDQARRIVGTLGVTVSDGEVQKIAERIIHDGLCQTRILDSLLAANAAEVLTGLHPLEKEALIQRLRIAGVRTALAPRGKANWVANRSPLSERAQIIASCPACSEAMKFLPAIGAGHLGKDFVFSHCGQNEICPDDVLHQWYQLADARPQLATYAPGDAEAKLAAAVAAQASQDRIDFLKHTGGKL